MALDMDLVQPFTVPDDSTCDPIEPAIPPTDTSPAEASASLDNTTSSRRLRPRRAKTPAVPNTTAPSQATGPRRPSARGTTSKKPSRAASKKKAVRREAALVATQAQQQPVTDTPAAAADSTPQEEADSK